MCNTPSGTRHKATTQHLRSRSSHVQTTPCTRHGSRMKAQMNRISPNPMCRLEAAQLQSRQLVGGGSRAGSASYFRGGYLSILFLDFLGRCTDLTGSSVGSGFLHQPDIWERHGDVISMISLQSGQLFLRLAGGLRRPLGHCV